MIYELSYDVVRYWLKCLLNNKLTMKEGTFCPSIQPSTHSLFITASRALSVTSVTEECHSCLWANMGLNPGRISTSFIEFRENCQLCMSSVKKQATVLAQGK